MTQSIQPSKTASCQPAIDGKYDAMYFVSLLSSLLLLLGGCSGPSDLRDTRFIMGTLVEFTISDADQEQAEQAIAAAAHEMQRIEDAFTIYGDQPNAVKSFNATPVGTAITLPDEVGHVLSRALLVQQQSNGAFNPSLAGLNLLWGFSSEPPPDRPPSAEAIRAALPPQRCIERRGNQWLRLDHRCQLDFGGIAKGYAIDRAIELFRQHGIANAIINAGGDIRLIGSHGKRAWRIGIRHPRKPGEVLKKLELTGDVSIVTSGDYERYFSYQGKKYHHILDPHSGWPSINNQSVTVIAPTAMLADAWSTALFVATPSSLPSSLQLLRVDSHGQVHGKLQVKVTTPSKQSTSAHNFATLRGLE
ncbi:MAG: FAD:protein FMN transferase [Mariprofundus sp.]